MINLNDSIDITIFMAMQVSKKCLELGENRPILFLSNPGVGKSTAVKEFAKINGYKEVLLRISNETPDTITGYDIASTSNKTEETTSAVHIRPSWFQHILDYKEEGKKSVLFLDEITTADNYVQGAALNLVFDRKCHSEYLPEDTLIVAAGNYAQNLSSEMNVLAPMLNRFVVVNLIPEISDIDAFLCKYKGSCVGKQIDFNEQLDKAMKALADQENISITRDLLNKSGEIIEDAIRLESKNLCKENKLDLKITELKDIYSDCDNDDPIPNFCSLRSLNYLRDTAIACMICFGKNGLNSKTFKSMIHGTVGLGISRVNGIIEKNLLTDRFYTAISNAASEIEKLNDKKLPIYNDFYNEIINNKSDLTVPKIDSLTKKMSEMMEDKDLKLMEKPINPKLISELFNKMKKTLITLSYSNFNMNTDGDFNKIVDSLKNSPETYIGYVTSWNKISKLVNVLDSIIRNPSKKYDQSTIENLTQFLVDARSHVHQLRLVKRILKENCDPQFFSTVPEISTIKSTVSI